MTTAQSDIRFEGSNGIYKVFVRRGDAYAYERTIATEHAATTRAAKIKALEESRTRTQELWPADETL